MQAVDHAAVNAFPHGAIDSKAAWSAMQQSPQNIDDAFGVFVTSHAQSEVAT